MLSNLFSLEVGAFYQHMNKRCIVPVNIYNFLNKYIKLLINVDLCLEGVLDSSFCKL